MTLAQLIALCIQTSLALALVAVGLTAAVADVTWLVRRPGLLLRSVLAMNVILPLIAVGIAVLFELHPAVEVAIVALSVSPIPPVLPAKEAKAGGTNAYIVALLVVAALLSIVFIPATLEVLRRLFAREAHVPAASLIAGIVFASVLAPLAAGMIVRALAPGIAARMAKPLGIFASVLLLVAFVPVVIVAWGRVVALVGDFTLVAIAAITVMGLVVGHLLGGPDPDDRTVLALSTGTRHPGVAVAIAQVSAPNQAEVQAAVLLALLSGMVLSMPYVKWRQRVHAQGRAA